jgi:hypothetical protein
MLNIIKQNMYLPSVCWTELYNYVKRHKRNRENIPAMKDYNGKINPDLIEKLTPYTLIMRLYSVANVITHKFNQQNQVNPSPLVLTL